MTGIESRTVDWWSVHRFALPLLDQVGSWPMAGSLPWTRLDTNDPVKLAAIYDAARHHILRVDMAQEARAEASQDISGGEDWAAVARSIRQRNSVYIPRRIA